MLLIILLFSFYFYFTNKKVTATVLFFALISDGFQLIPESLLFMKGGDCGLIYLITIFFHEFQRLGGHIFNIPLRIKRAIYYFFLFLIAIILVNVIFYQVPIKEIMRTGRLYLFLLSIFLFTLLSVQQIEKTLFILFKITLLCSIIYISQSFIHKPLLTGGVTIPSGWSIGGITIPRYFNTPMFLLFSFFYCLFVSPFKGRKKIVCIAVLGLTIILPASRSLIIFILLGLIFGRGVQTGKFSGALKYVVIVGLVFLPFMNILTERFEKDDTKGDINAVLSGTYKPTMYDQNSGNLTFRIAHFYERAKYVIQHPIYILFGVGFMTEDSKLANQFNFKIGLQNEETGLIIQLDTGDIAWSVLILRLGIVGTIFYLLIVIQMLIFSFKNKNNPISMILFIMLLIIVLQSISSPGLADIPTSFILPMLLVMYVYKQEEIAQGL